MTGRTFWVLSFLLLATASHLAFVLFLPNMDAQALYEDIATVAGVNKIKPLSNDEIGQLSSLGDRKLVHAVCAYDLTNGPVRLNARLPDNYWSISIYSPRGDVIYTLNDRQANATALTILISAATRARIGPEFKTELLGRYEVKGREESLEVHALLAGPKGAGNADPA